LRAFHLGNIDSVSLMEDTNVNPTPPHPLRINMVYYYENYL
jgi:hypothetical protein